MIQNTRLHGAAGGVDARQPTALIPEALPVPHLSRAGQCGGSRWRGGLDMGRRHNRAGRVRRDSPELATGDRAGDPPRGVHIDLQTRTLRVAYTSEQIKARGPVRDLPWPCGRTRSAPSGDTSIGSPRSPTAWSTMGGLAA